MSCRSRWFPRPRSTQALAPTPGCTRCGISSEVSSSRGEPTRSAGGGGHGPPVTSPTPASASTPMAPPRWWAIISSMPTPQRSAAARTLPALVPTTRSTSASGHGRRSCRAGSAPVIQAAPSTPPAPSTRPTRGRDPRGATSEPMSALGHHERATVHRHVLALEKSPAPGVLIRSMAGLPPVTASVCRPAPSRGPLCLIWGDVRHAIRPPGRATGGGRPPVRPRCGPRRGATW